MLRGHYTTRPDHRAGELHEQDDGCSLSFDWLNAVVWGGFALAFIGFWVWIAAVVIDWFS